MARNVQRRLVGAAVVALIAATATTASPQTLTDAAGPPVGQGDLLGALISHVVIPPAVAIGEGVASWYGPNFAGRRTANGEIFNPEEMTAAHRTLPFGSRVKVTNMDTGEEVIVRINDRGPFHGGRVIDLSQAAARQVGMIRAGEAAVRLDLLPQ